MSKSTSSSLNVLLNAYYSPEGEVKDWMFSGVA